MRYVVAIGLVLTLLVSLVAIKYKQIASLIHMGEEMEKAGPPPEVVSSAIATQSSWDGALTSTATVSAAKGVSVSTEIPGVVAAIRFESGAIVKQGAILVVLDSRVEQAQIASIVARRDLAKINADRTRALVASKAVSASQLDTDDAQLKSANADLGALQAQIERKVVRAPFAGKLGIRSINVGQFLNPGAVITSLEAMDSVYVDFSIPQQRASDVRVGTKVTVTVAGSSALGKEVKDESFEGMVAAIEPNVDAVTRTMRLRASVPNKDDKLRPGMFANVSVSVPKQDGASVVTVPAMAIAHASYGDSVFVVEDKKDEKTGAPVAGAKIARQQLVRLGESRGDFVAVIDGVKVGQEIVTAGVFKLRNNAGVTINNSVKLDQQAAPKLENH
jgi:membrane fusion protein, multidrug efflux system